MAGRDYTDLGGAGYAFLTTHWSLIDGIQSTDDRSSALINVLLKKYWNPVYCYLRRKGHNNEQAKDLTQGFFHEVVLNRDLVHRADQEKGRFRAFLLHALDQYLSNEKSKRMAQKRHPKGSFISLELGEISDVIETPIGFHIMQVIEKKEDTVNLQHILIKIAENNDDESRTVEFLKELKKRAEDDELFDELAKEFSDDPEAKNTGGNIGWIYIEGIQEEIEPFKKVLPVLKVGEISEPFKTQFGYIIVKLEDKAEKHRMTLETDRETIEQYAKYKKSNDEFIKFLQKSKEEVFIEIKEPLQ